MFFSSKPNTYGTYVQLNEVSKNDTLASTILPAKTSGVLYFKAVPLNTMNHTNISLLQCRESIVFLSLHIIWLNDFYFVLIKDSFLLPPSTFSKTLLIMNTFTDRYLNTNRVHLMGKTLKTSSLKDDSAVYSVLYVSVCMSHACSYSLLMGLSPIIWCRPLQYHNKSVASLDPETM